MAIGATAHGIVAHAGGVTRTPADVFDQIYVVFLALGTLVGVVVIGYTVYNAVAYRATGARAGESAAVARPSLGELPRGSGGGRKLFVSFGISAVIVVSLVLWTYSALLYVDAGAAPHVEGQTSPAVDGLTDDGVLVVDVIGQQFSWVFVYPNGHRSTTLHVPRDVPVKLNVTSTDVMHNIGIPAFNAKTDAIPGQTTTTWFVAERTGTFEAACYELCGSGHSVMRSDVVVMERDEYQTWYDGTANETDGGETDAEGATNGTDGANGTDGGENDTDGATDGTGTADGTAQQSVATGADRPVTFLPASPRGDAA